MFTGIIEMMGTVVRRGRYQLTLTPKRSLGRLSVGDSIAIDGVCLTIDKMQGKKLTFRLLSETMRVSTLGKLRLGDTVNLERSLRVGNRLGGHLLLGHVDGRGKIISRIKKGKNYTFTLRVPNHLSPYLVPKGSIGIDGISLTLDACIRPAPPAKRGKRSGRSKAGQELIIKVHIIPHTAAVTSLGRKGSGDWVNLEADMIAKYLHRTLWSKGG